MIRKGFQYNQNVHLCDGNGPCPRHPLLLIQGFDISSPENNDGGDKMN